MDFFTLLIFVICSIGLALVIRRNVKIDYKALYKRDMRLFFIPLVGVLVLYLVGRRSIALVVLGITCFVILLGYLRSKT